MPSLFELLKHTHVWCVTLSLILFFVRLSWLRKHADLLERRLIKILPHVIDTILAVTGVAMVFVLHLHQHFPLWLTYKLALLFSYIVFGWFALHRTSLRPLSASLAIISVALMIWLAVNKPV